MKQYTVRYNNFTENVKNIYPEDRYFIDTYTLESLIPILEFKNREDKDKYFENYDEELIVSTRWIPKERIIDIMLNNTINNEIRFHTCNRCGMMSSSVSYRLGDYCLREGCYGRYV